MNIQSLVLDINKKCNQIVTANVGEVGSRFLKINIIDNGIPVDLTGITVYLYAKKPDDTKVFNTVEVEDVKQGVVSVEITSQILAMEGLVKLTLLLVKNKSKLCTKQFLLNVDSSIVDDEAIESTNEFTALINALDRVNNVRDEIEGVLEDLGYVTPQMFGAKADGVTDDSEAILQAIASLPKDGGKLYFPAGTYIHGDGITTGLGYKQNMSYAEGHAYYPAILMQKPGDDKIGRSIKFDFKGYTNLTIKGDGAIIQSHENNGECSNNRFFTFTECENVLIEGITIDGKRHERGIRFSDYSPGGYDLSRTNLQFEKCKRVIIRNVISKGSQMDGMAIGAGSQTEYNEDFLIEKCKFLDNHRQGISIEGATNVTIRDTECSYNGTGQGIMPKSGIDIEAYGDVNEYEHYSFNHNILIDKCYFDSNGYQNIVCNNNSFNTTIQNCTFKNAWVNAQANNEAKLLNCRLENCRLSNGFSRIAYNTIIYNKGGHLINSVDVSENSTSIIEHNIFDLTPVEETFTGYNYNTIRLTGKETFRNNHVKNAISLKDSSFYPVQMACKEVANNIFELTLNAFNGLTTKKEIRLTSDTAKTYIVKDNRFIGYTYSTDVNAHHNSYSRTDYSVKKAYNSKDFDITKAYKISSFGGEIRINVRYLEQEEEIIIVKQAGYAKHEVLRRSSALGNVQLVTLYKDSTGYYLKYTYKYTSTIVECVYAYAGTHTSGLEFEKLLNASDVDVSNLTTINFTDITKLTTTLKSNYDKAYTHSASAHAPANAQKNSDITKAEIEAKLTGNITSHTHDGIGDFVQNNWGSENVGKVLMIGSDGRVSLYDLANFNPNAEWFTVTQNYTNVTSDFNSNKVKESLPLTITLTTTNGKGMGAVTVIMNGVDITASAYNSSNNQINIEAVLGDIIITAKAMLYTNLAEPNNTNTSDMEIWINGKKYDNYGNLNDVSGYVLTNYISLKQGDIVRIKGLEVGVNGINVHMSAWYSNKSHYFTQSLEGMNGNGFFSDYTVDTVNNTVQFTSKVGAVAFARFTGKPVNGNENVIITVNEEIK